MKKNAEKPAEKSTAKAESATEKTATEKAIAKRPPEIVVVSTTTARKEEAEILAAELVTRRLAACVQIVGPITSAFHWQGKVEHSEEWLCQIKTRRDKYAELEAVLRQLHPYDVPEIVAVPAVLASESYAQWLSEELDRKTS
jgi:periplasmic divalent cation tolerance protein